MSLPVYHHIYISGPMRGRPAYNFPAFFDAEKFLHELFPDAEIMNPAREDIERAALWDLFAADPSGFQAGEYLLNGDVAFTHDDLKLALGADLGFITQCADLVAILPGWRDSAGATAEIATANALGVSVQSVENLRHGMLHEIKVRDRIDAEDMPGVTPSAPDFVVPNDADRTVLGPEATLASMEPTEGSRRYFDDAGRLMEVDPSTGIVTPVTVQVGETRTTSSTGGQKGVKLAAFSQISPEIETLIAEHFGKGARKYAAHNFRKGYEWSKSYDALRRHLAAFWAGEEYDNHTEACPEGCTDHTGSLHIVAVIWHAMVLTEFYLHHPEFDDRYSTHPEFYAEEDKAYEDAQ